MLRPAIAIPIHWGTLLRVGLGRRATEILHAPARRFAAQLAERAPGVEPAVLEPGESVELSLGPIRGARAGRLALAAGRGSTTTRSSPTVRCGVDQAHRVAARLERQQVEARRGVGIDVGELAQRRDLDLVGRAARSP